MEFKGDGLSQQRCGRSYRRGLSADDAGKFDWFGLLVSMAKPPSNRFRNGTSKPTNADGTTREAE